MKLEAGDLDRFLRTHLKINDWKSILERSPLDLFRKIVYNHVIHIYFHNLQITATPLAEREVPTVEEIISNGLEGNGGNCLQSNYFLRILLDSLGFDVITIAATIGPTRPNDLLYNHVMTVVRFSATEIYAVDVASASPLAEPVPIHQLPFRYKSGGVCYEYRQISESKYAEFLIGGGLFRKELANGLTEERRLEFDLIPRDFEFLHPPMQIIWKDTENFILCRNLFLFRHFLSRPPSVKPINDNESDPGTPTAGDQELCFVLVCGKHILVGTGTEKHIQSYGSYEEMVPDVCSYFPKFDVAILKKAIEYLNTVEPVPIRF